MTDDRFRLGIGDDWIDKTQIREGGDIAIDGTVPVPSREGFWRGGASSPLVRIGMHSRLHVLPIQGHSSARDGGGLERGLPSSLADSILLILRLLHPLSPSSHLWPVLCSICTLRSCQQQPDENF